MTQSGHIIKKQNVYYSYNEKEKKEFLKEFLMFKNLFVLMLGLLIVFISDPALADKKNEKAKHLKDLSCAVNEIARFNGIEWQCSLDENSDTLGSLSCNTNQIAEFNGSQWICADKAGGSTSSLNGGKFQFVGQTSTAVLGDAGAGKFSELCATEVSPDSRFCTSKEVLQTANPFPTLLPFSDQMWVHPYIVGMYPISTPNGADGIIIDYSGVTAKIGDPGNEGLSCRGWTSTGFSGLLIADHGQFLRSGCNVLKRVACCGPR